jgi:hypothetical protein
LTCGQEVVYLHRDGSRHGGTICDVHFDEAEPYYSVRLANGSEKQTVRDRLELPARNDGLAQHLQCPITLEVMTDPVIAADGITYERTAIEDWLRTHNTSPLTNTPLTSKSLTPNLVVRGIISSL